MLRGLERVEARLTCRNSHWYPRKEPLASARTFQSFFFFFKYVQVIDYIGLNNQFSLDLQVFQWRKAAAVKLCSIMQYFHSQIWQQVCPFTLSLIFCAVVQHPTFLFVQLPTPSLPTGRHCCMCFPEGGSATDWSLSWRAFLKTISSGW